MVSSSRCRGFPPGQQVRNPQRGDPISHPVQELLHLAAFLSRAVAFAPKVALEPVFEMLVIVQWPPGLLIRAPSGQLHKEILNRLKVRLLGGDDLTVGGVTGQLPVIGTASVLPF